MLPEESRRFRLSPSLVLLPAVVFGLLWLIVTGLTDNGSKSAKAPDDKPVTSTSVTPQPTATKKSQPAVDLPALQSRAELAIRSYASFPNKKGRDATLNQLRPLLSTSALAQIRRQWSGPEVTTVSMRATEVRFSEQPFSRSSERIVFEALVTQKATFAETPSQIYLPTILATFELQKDKWVITDLRELGA